MEFMRDLERPQEALTEQFVRRQASDILTVHHHTPRSRLKNARDHVEKSGFSGTIWTDQPSDRAFFDAQRSSVYGMKAAEVFMEVVDDNHFDPQRRD